MQLGVCQGELDARECADAGFDFIELPASQVLDAGRSDAEWGPVRDRILAAGLPTPVCNLFFPSEIRLVGPRRELARAVEHADRIFARLSEIGGRVQVFGSGGARAAPEGYPRQRAVDELKELASRIAPLAAARGVVVAMEHLRAAETSTLNTLEETLAFVRDVNHPAVRLLVDNFHLAQMDEPLDAVRRCGGLMAHVHVADPLTRLDPAAAGTDLRPLFKALKAIGYDARVSLECRWQDRQANLKPSRDLVAAQWAET